MILDAIDGCRIVIVGGSGGVGKTSISAALGILGALKGKKTLVLTIDPARRLAGALGLDGIGRDAADVTPRLQETGLEVTGSLHAMMLDVQNTFDRLVERYTPDAETRRQIRENRLYQNISTRLSGSQEYASMQRLYEIASEENYDLIVLDTPPSTHALDFLTAPKRLLEFFDSRVVQLFLNFGGKVGWGLLKRSTDVFFKALERLTGGGVLEEIATFFRVAESILEPYRTQSDKTEALLRQHDTAFVIVTGPDSHQLDAAGEFRTMLANLGIRVAGLVVNRWLPPTGDDPATWQAPAGDALAARIADWAGRIERVAQAQTAAIDTLRKRAALPLAVIPVYAEDIHAIAGLRYLARHLAPNTGA